MIFYKSNHELFDKLAATQSAQIICPSPLIADNLRLGLGLSDITTISKWVSDRLKSQGLVKTRKADLMLNLAAIWHHYFSEHHFGKFMEAFELFTELRSFTLNLELLSEFFKELEADMVRSILIFWAYIEQEKLVDEQLSYQRVSESFEKSSNADTDNGPLVFVGFKHMNGVQIDMLKTLSEKQKVDVYFPQSVYSEALPGDWIKWLITDSTHLSTSLSLRSEQAKTKLKVIIPLKGRTNEAVKYFFDSHDNNHANTHDLVLATSASTFFQIQEVHYPGSFFKVTEDFFYGAVEKMSETLKSFIANNSSAVDILNHLEKLKSDSFACGDYKFAKVIELTSAAFNVFIPLQDKINDFSVDMVTEVVRLNVPRSSMIALEKNIKRNIIDLNGLSLFANVRPCAVLATQGMGGFKRSEKVLSEKMSKALRIIGPLKRTSLEFSFFKHDLILTLKNPECVLFIDRELLTADLSWREILNSFELEQSPQNLETSSIRKIDYISEKMKPGPHGRSNAHFSASSLQTFIDCPRKYYFSYVDKLESRPDLNSSLEPAQLGNLEHAVIAQYFQSAGISSEVDLLMHRRICREAFDGYALERGLNLNKTVNAKSYLEVLHYSLNGIVYLIEFIIKYKAKHIDFERPLLKNIWNLKGSIDCVVTLANNQIAIFDFKRSASAAGTKFETENFQKIQIWIYLLVLIESGHSVHSFGYINLSDLSDDKLLYESLAAEKILNSPGGSLENAKVFLEQVIATLNSTIDFWPTPREEKVCNYCPITLFCHRGKV